MRSNEIPNKTTSQIIEDICQIFKQPENPNNVDLVRLREYMKRSNNLSDTHMFNLKLKDLNKYDAISRQNFSKHFSPNIKNEKHFSMAFDEIDKEQSGKITKKNLQLYNKEAGLNLSKTDIDLMFNYASKDGQTVFKQDLFKFMNPDQKEKY